MTAEPAPPSGESVATGVYQRKGFDMATLVNLGWFGTGMALLVAQLPVKLMLKNELHLSAEAVAGFLLIGHIPIYIKPFAGILSDAVPMFGTRRRSYLLMALLLSAVFYLLLGVVPRQYSWLLAAYFGLSVFQTFTSTVMGGLMVEVGKLRNATGRLSAQRLGITRVVGIIGEPMGGLLTKVPFFFTTVVCALLYLALYPLYHVHLQEARSKTVNRDVFREMGRQFMTLISSRPLWAAAGLVVLVVAAPGFETALLYYQQDHLKFDSAFIGWLGASTAVGAMLGAVIYSAACLRMKLRSLLAWTIVIHAVMTLFYLLYRTPMSAIIIAGVESATLTMALLPLYDLSARATPTGSEALGYSLMMSVWNLTKNLSDLAGAMLYSKFGLTFNELVWVNAGTTLVVLVAVPFLPAVLLDRKDGDREEPGLAVGH
ncbi:MAG: MFS transporter [Actinomycetota bacterium]